MVRSLQSHLSSNQLSDNRGVGWLCLILAFFGVLVSRLYLFAIRPIQFFDESLYLAYTNGVLKYGAIPEWSSNPGVALLNALWFAPLYDVPLGLDYASRIGMVVAECAIFLIIAWLSYSIFRGRQWQILSIVLALVSAPFWSISQNSSDTYYALWVVFIFASLWMALHRPPTHPIWLGVATIIAVSASIRNDGTLVFVGASLIYAIYLWRSPLTWRQRLIASVGVWLLPMGFILLLYWGLVVRGGGVYFPYSDSVGMPANETSLGGRTYLAFEQGEGYSRRFDYIKQGEAWWVEGPALAEELYGTREQNNNNVFLAITRNPGAWLNRLKWNVRDFFLGWHEAFTLHALPLFLVAFWGWGLAWRHHWRFALAGFIILIPTLAYFGLTFWSYRYVTFLAPLWILLATYAVFAFYSVPHLPDLKWNGLIALITGVGGFLFIDAVDGRSVPIPPYTLFISVTLYALFFWRFLRVTVFPVKWVNVATWGVVIALVVGAFSPFPPPTAVSNRSQIEIRSYLLSVYEVYRDRRVCVNFSDLGATSLAWHARQVPVFITQTTMATAAEEGRLTEIFKDRACRFGLQTGTIEEHLRIIETTPNDALFLQGNQNIFFFEIKNE